MNPICRDVSRSVFDKEIILMKYDVSIDKKSYSEYIRRPGLESYDSMQM